MDKQLVKSNWKAIKGEIRKAWGILTDDDLDQSNGNLKTVSDLVHKNYGQKKEEIKRQLDVILESFNQKNTRRIKYNVVVRDLRDRNRH